MTDDVGFGASSVFGGPIPTPAFASLAKRGLRYNDFNTAAICSPSRAALLTGRNPQHVGMGDVSEAATDFDGYTSVIPKSAATVAAILRDNGYATAMIGKWHLTPQWEMGPLGPFDHWPTGMGFQYFYGFLAGDTDQYAPNLEQNTTAVIPPAHDPHYILDRDLADHAVRWIQTHHALEPSTPFFMYYAPGSTHGPQQAPAAWIAKFRGKFDQGWDMERKEIFARQKAMGIIPANAKLTPRPAVLPAWDTLSPDRKRVDERFMEVYAAQLAFTDHEIGRVINALKKDGEYDNTLIVYIQGDNGPSAEGGPNGKLYEQALGNPAPEPLPYLLSHIDSMGGPKTYEVYPAGWAWAMATPFQYFKQIASHFGGTRNGMVISWPDGIRAVGGLRTQFCYIADITPTILDAVGIPDPKTVGGVDQMPMDGKSLRYTFDDATASSRRHTQYFDVVQNIALYHEGWVAATRPLHMPWQFPVWKRAVPLDGRQWELYHVSRDFSEADDLAAQRPGKLKRLQALFLRVAARNNVLPIHPRRVGTAGRPLFAYDRPSVTYYPGMPPVHMDSLYHVINQSFVISASVDIPRGGAHGVLLARGSRFVGYSFYLTHDRLAFCFNAVPPRIYKVTSASTIAPGHHVLGVQFVSDRGAPGAGGTITLSVDGKPVADGRVAHTPTDYWENDWLDIGENLLTPVSDDYDVPARFTGRLHSVTLTYR